MSKSIHPHPAAATPATAFTCEPLEERTLLSWGTIPTFIHQDLARTNYPQYTGQGVTIVDIDAGISLTHPKLAGQIWTNPTDTTTDGIDQDGSSLDGDLHGWNYLAGNNNVAEVFPNEYGHGTETGGTIVASHYTNTGNGGSYAGDNMEYEGIASGAKLISLKASHIVPVGSYVDFTAVGNALNWVVKNHTKYNIVAVNMSLGTATYSDYGDHMRQQLLTLYNAGVVVVAAAGNIPGTGMQYPANSPYVISAGGVDPATNTMTTTTTRGSTLDYVDILGPGKNTPYLDLSGHYNLSAEATSDATAFITGASALIKQVNPAFTVADVLSILQDSGVSVTENMDSPPRTYQRLDLNAALQLAVQRANPQSPFGGVAIAVPGQIEAENFDDGGEGVAYHDTTASNEGPSTYRATGVDLQPTTDTNGGDNVGWTHTGEWLEYTFHVATAGNYNLFSRVAHNAAGASFHLEVDGTNVSGTLAMPNTGGTQTWQTLASGANVALSAGDHVLRVAVDSQSSNSYAGNFNWFSIQPASRDATQPIEAESFDAQQGTTPSGGIVGYVDQGDWLRYDNVNFGNGNLTQFIMNLAVDAGHAGRRIQVRLDSLTGPIVSSLTVQATGVNGDWSHFVSQSALLNQSITGIHTVYFTFDGGNAVGNLDWFEFA